MIDDRGGRTQAKPVAWVSIVDMEALGFSFEFSEMPKTKQNGEVVTAVRIVSVTKDGEKFPKSYMAEYLHVLGLDTIGEGKHWWICPKKYHRCLSKQHPVLAYRLMSYERSDKVFLESGRASLEIQLWASNMSDLHEELNGAEDE